VFPRLSRTVAHRLGLAEFPARMLDYRGNVLIVRSNTMNQSIPQVRGVRSRFIQSLITSSLIARRCAGFALILAFFVLGACAPSNRRTFQEPDVEYAYHTVNYQGETLSLIAKWYTGQSGNWEVLLDHNPELDPRKLRSGDLVKIPRELLIREEEMPKKFVVNSYSKPAAQKPQSRPVDSGAAAASAAAQPSSAVESNVVESGSQAVAESAVSAAEAAAKSEARTKSRDELLQELLEDQ